MAFLVNQEFNPWSGTVSPDGIWRLAGPWFGTGNNQFDPSRETLTSTYPGQTSTGFLNLTITPSTNPLQGGEIQTLTEYGYGYYEVRMKTSPVSGGVASFFLVDFDSPWHEYDIEFLLNHKNEVTFTNYNGSGTTYYNLGFDPSADFHTYGILWEPGKVTDYVDGVAVRSETNPYFVADADGMNIMMNVWSGNPNWGGGPPATNSTTVYDWVHFTPLGEPPPPTTGTVSINNVSLAEGDSGTKLETFTVTRSGGTAAFDVNYATANGSATTADGDYAATSGTLHFETNQNTQRISVTINGDTKVETNETFNVNLSNTTNGATISDGVGVGTITNDDVAQPPPPPPENIIIGTNRNDVLTSTSGDDQITTKNGRDLVVFQGTTFGHDTVTDFRVGPANRHDTIQFDHSAFADFDAVLAHATQVGTDTVITFDANNSVTLTGVSQLQAYDFQFV